MRTCQPGLSCARPPTCTTHPLTRPPAMLACAAAEHKCPPNQPIPEVIRAGGQFPMGMPGYVSRLCSLDTCCLQSGVACGAMQLSGLLLTATQ